MIRCYNCPHRFYVGVDLHARTMITRGRRLAPAVTLRGSSTPPYFAGPSEWRGF